MLALSLITLLVPQSAHAGESPNGDVAVAWPADFSEYTMADGSSIVDVQDNNPAYSDIWGGSADDLPSTYFDSDGSNIFIRLRVRGKPDSKNGGYQSTVFLVSIAASGTQAAVIGLNGKPSSVDYVYAGNADGTTIREVYTTPFTNDGSGTSAGARWSAAPDEGYFVDFQVPISAITAVAPTVTPTTPIQLFFGSSQAANLSVINKDFMIGTEVSYVGLSTVTLSGAPAGSAPSAADDTATVSQDGSVLIDAAANDTDADGDLDPTTAAVAGVPANGTATANGDGTFTYAPDPGYTGADSFTYTICDSLSLCDTASVSITVDSASATPEAVPDATVVPEDGAVTIDAAANDTDADGDLDPATAVVASPPANGAALANGDGTFTYTPAPNFHGSDAFTYTVCDAGARCDTASISVTVDPVGDAPVAAADALTVSEDGSAAVDAVGNDTDVDGNLDPASAVVASPPANGAALANGDGTFTYTPAPDFSGADSFAYTVCDTGGLCDSATVAVTVDPVNDAPVANEDTLTLPEDTVVSVDVLANDVDVDGDALTISGFDATTSSGGIVSCAAAACTYTPGSDFSGADSFTYTVDDGNGGTDTATVAVTVVGVNDPPGVTDDPVATDEDTSLLITVLANDTDPEGNTLSIDFVTQPPSGTVIDNGDGTLTYTPAADFYGSDAFAYRACDDGTPSLCDEANVTVTVDAINDPPIAGSDSVATDEDVPATFDVLPNDFDQDGDGLTVTAFDAVSAAGGVVTCTAGGSCTYTPPSLYSGPDSFSYTVGDGNGDFDTTAVTIVIGPVNNRPVAGDDGASVTEDTATTLVGAILVGNDTDPDLDSLTITAVTNGAHGTATVAAGDILYTPAPDYHGPDTITYTICDPGGLCDTAEVIVTVDPANDNPVGKDDTATTDEDVPVTVSVLGNDADIDGDALSVTLIPTTPTNGTAVINGDNTITYTPAPDFFGVDEFQYEIDDGQGGTTTAWVRFVTVNPVNDAPVAGPDAVIVDEDASVTLDVIGNDTDVDDTVLTVAALGLAGNGTVLDNGDGTVTYTPDPDFYGSDSFTYAVCDPGGLCANETVAITIDPLNDAPVLVDDPVVGPEDEAVTVDVLANDADVDGDVLAVVGVSDGVNGSVVVNGDGTVTYTPNPDFFGTDAFTYSASDGTATVVGTATVTVAPVNDAPVLVDDPVVGPEDEAVTVDVLANDADVDGDVLAVVGVSDGVNGSVVVNGDGTVTYTPNPDFFGTDAFTYSASDGSATLVGAVTVILDPVNDAPVAVDDVLAGDEDAPITMDPAANDSDIDGDVVTVAGVTDPANGEAVVNPDGTVTYTPDPNFFGTDAFTYTATDGTTTVVGAVSVTVTEVNDPPSAPELIPLSAAFGELPPSLAVFDPEGAVLSVSVVDGTLPPGLILNPDGTWSGEATEQGTFFFTVEVCDPELACTTAVLSVSVALLPSTGIDAAVVARLATLLILLGWATVHWSSRLGRRS